MVRPFNTMWNLVYLLFLIRTERIQQHVRIDASVYETKQNDCLYSYLIQDMKPKNELLRNCFRNKNQCLIVHPDIKLIGHLIQSFTKPFLKRFDKIKILLSPLPAGIFLTTFFKWNIGLWGRHIAK